MWYNFMISPMMRITYKVTIRNHGDVRVTSDRKFGSHLGWYRKETLAIYVYTCTCIQYTRISGYRRRSADIGTSILRFDFTYGFKLLPVGPPWIWDHLRRAWIESCPNPRSFVGSLWRGKKVIARQVGCAISSQNADAMVTWKYLSLSIELALCFSWVY